MPYAAQPPRQGKENPRVDAGRVFLLGLVEFNASVLEVIRGWLAQRMW